MRSEADKTVDALNGFLRGEISAVETYRQAIEKLGGSPTGAQLEDCRRSHEQRVAKLRDQVARLGGGGVYLNVGSAVVLPEVFVKALNLARNVGHDVKDFTTANLDQIRHYRPRVNVLQRPGGRAIELIGHHELTFPLLRLAVLARLMQRSRESQ